jgi:hypothetical protein
MKHTAVEWLVREFTFKTLGGVYTTDGTDDVTHLVEQAKEMEKEQMIDAFVEGMRCQNFDPNRGRAEQYFNETFKTNEK